MLVIDPKKLMRRELAIFALFQTACPVPDLRLSCSNVRITITTWTDKNGPRTGVIVAKVESGFMQTGSISESSLSVSS